MSDESRKIWDLTNAAANRAQRDRATVRLGIRLGGLIVASVAVVLLVFYLVQSNRGDVSAVFDLQHWRRISPQWYLFGIAAVMFGAIVGGFLGALVCHFRNRSSSMNMHQSPVAQSDIDESDPFFNRFADREASVQPGRERSVALRSSLDAGERFDEIEIEVVEEGSGPTISEAIHIERSVNALRSGTLIGGSVAFWMSVVLVLVRMVYRLVHWQDRGAPVMLLLELVAWIVLAVFVVGIGAFVGRLIGLFVSLGNGWRKDLLFGDTIQCGASQAVDDIPGHAGASKNRRRISQYVRWPISGSFSILVVYVVLQFAIWSTGEPRRINAQTPVLLQVVGLLLGMAGSVIVGGVIGVGLRGLWDFIVALIVNANTRPSELADNTTRDPFAQRFGG